MMFLSLKLRLGNNRILVPPTGKCKIIVHSRFELWPCLTLKTLTAPSLCIGIVANKKIRVGQVEKKDFSKLERNILWLTLGKQSTTEKDSLNVPFFIPFEDCASGITGKDYRSHHREASFEPWTSSSILSESRCCPTPPWPYPGWSCCISS